MPGFKLVSDYQAKGDQIWLDRAVRHAERLAEIRTERDGAWWFPYLFPWTYYQRTMTVPWWSGMAQGQALSLFVRLYEETGDGRWSVAADKTWQSFLQPRSAAEPWSTMVDGDSLWFEEYAGNQPPLLVLNGQIFAIFVITIAVAEAAVGLGILIALFRNKETVQADEIDLLKW